jgi:hypothetical protein
MSIVYPLYSKTIHKREGAMRFLLKLLFITISITLFGCSDNSKLTRSNAKVMIQNSSLFNSVTANFPNKIEIFKWNNTVYYGNDVEKILSSLANNGLITYSIIQDPTKIFKNTSVYLIFIADKGKKYVVNEKKRDWGQGEEITWTVKLSDRTVVDILGIEMPTPQTAEITFSHKTTNLTPFGFTASNICTGKPEGGIAHASLFDDGWRITSVETDKILQ